MPSPSPAGPSAPANHSRRDGSGASLAGRIAYAALRASVLVLGGYLMLRFIAPALLAIAHRGLIAEAVWMVAFDRLAALGALGAAALAVAWRRQDDAAWWSVAFGALAVTLAWGESGHIVGGLAKLLTPLVFTLVPLVAATVVIEKRRAFTPLPFGALFGLAAALLSTALLAGSLGSRPLVNRLGLISGPPNTTTAEDYTKHPLKDGYPPCTVTNNSLGYRDVEPGPRGAARRRVLVVGDSFIWGEGIPTSDDTLPELLRRRLEEAAPGAWDVTSAAYPGLGAYGYRRALERMIPEVQPDVVIVGWLGSPDVDPMDVQHLADLLPRSPWLAGAIVRLRTLHDLHEASVMELRAPAFREVYGGRWRDLLFESLSDFARSPGKRSILLRYDGASGPIAGVETRSIPPEWRYPGHRSELWYAKDSHPKPPLNRKIAEWLGGYLLRPGPAAGSDGPGVDSETSDRPRTAEAPEVIGPGQERLVLEMLGGSTLVAGCRLETAAVQKDHIEAKYECAGGPSRVVTVLHRSLAPRGSVSTARFALTMTGDDGAHRDFLERLGALVRQREGEFVWSKADRASGSASPGDPSQRSLEPPRPRPWRAIGALVAAVAMLLAAWRRPSAGAAA